MGVDFSFMQMVKTLYNKYPIYFGILISIIFVGLFSILTIEYEIYNSLIVTLLDAAWYVFITIMTIGYGDMYAVSFFGQISMIVATFTGIVFSSIFVVCVEKFFKMDES